jgi:hypothetical protein
LTQESQETRTVSFQKEEQISGARLLELIGALAWLTGFVIIGIAVVTAYTTPARIVEYAGSNGALTIQGVEFRQILAGIFLMGFRTIVQGALWLKKKTGEGKSSGSRL